MLLLAVGCVCDLSLPPFCVHLVAVLYSVHFIRSPLLFILLTAGQPRPEPPTVT